MARIIDDETSAVLEMEHHSKTKSMGNTLNMWEESLSEAYKREDYESVLRLIDRVLEARSRVNRREGILSARLTHEEFIMQRTAEQVMEKIEREQKCSEMEYTLSEWEDRLLMAYEERDYPSVINLLNRILEYRGKINYLKGSLDHGEWTDEERFMKNVAQTSLSLPEYLRRELEAFDEETTA